MTKSRFVTWWQVYRDRSGNFRVSVRASNGQKLFASSEGYTRKNRAIANAIRFGAPQALRWASVGVEVRTS